MLNILAQPPLFWEAFFLIFVRMSAVLLTAPIFASRAIPTTVRLILALVLALTMLPVVTEGIGALPEDLPTFVAFIAREAFVGVLTGFAVYLIFAGIQAAGTIIGLQMGFSLANVVNPMTGDHASLIDQFYAIVAALVYLAMDGHHGFLIGVQRTYELVPLDRASLQMAPVTDLLPMGGALFVTAVRIALPIMAALLITDVGLAIIARSVPQMNVFVVGMPIKILIAFVFIGLTLPLVILLVTRLLGNLAPVISAVVRLL